MKNLNKVIASAIVLAAFGVKANAQTQATASSTATLLAPITISKLTDLNFGTLAASHTVGTVTVNYDDARTSDPSVKLLAAGAVKAATFKVTGEGTQGFSISMPTSVTLTNGTAANDMSVDLTCEQGSASALVATEKILRVKGVLHVGSDQPAGVYTNAADLAITVNYN